MRTSAVPVQQHNTLHGYTKKVFRSWRLYLLILPAVLYLAIFHYAPMYGLQIAFKNYRPSRGFDGSAWVGLRHFSRFLSYPNFWKIIGNTLTLSLYSLATFPCAVIAALLINELDHPGYKRTVQMVSYAPHFVSTVVIVAMLKLFTDRTTGIFNGLITALGGTAENWMAGTGGIFPFVCLVQRVAGAGLGHHRLSGRPFRRIHRIA